MNSLYGMQRANGDWFAIDDRGHLRMPVFHSIRQAMVARTRHWGMMLFKPVVVNERVIENLAPKDGESGAYFLLVDDPSASLSRGQPLEHSQLALLIHDAVERQ